MLRRLLVTVVCGLVLGSLLTGRAWADPPFKYPEGRFGKGELRYINGLPVLTVEGSPEEIGEAVGTLALKPGRRLANYPQDILKHFYVSLLWTPLLESGKSMAAKFPGDYRTEMETMARVANVERDKLVVANTLFDLKKVFFCSALLVEPERSTTGGTLVGRNLDFPTLGYLHEYSLVTIYKPQGAKHAFASVGFPGVVGCLSGMNDAGLAVAVLEVGQVKAGEAWFDHHGTPYALCYRRLLEECSTIAEVHAMLKQMKHTALSNLVVGDREGVAVFEITPRHVILRRSPEGATVCTNHFCSEELKSRTPVNIHHTFNRFTTLEKVSKLQRRLGLSDLQVAMHATSHVKDTMQTMVFEPGTLRLNLAIGLLPSSAGELRVLDLGPLFRREER